jgi:hypothetical protein
LIIIQRYQDNHSINNIGIKVVDYDLFV